MTFLTIFAFTEILSSLRLVLEGKAGKEISESSRLEFLEKLSANNLALLDAEDNTSGLLNTRRVAHLPFLRTLLAIGQTSSKPSFCQVIESFVLLAYISLPASQRLLKQLFSCLSIILDSGNLFRWYKRRK